MSTALARRIGKLEQQLDTRGAPRFVVLCEKGDALPTGLSGRDIVVYTGVPDDSINSPLNPLHVDGLPTVPTRYGYGR
jgi:hypothetical protein